MKNMKIILRIALFAATEVLAFAQEYDPESDFRTATVGRGICITGYVGSKQEVYIPPQIWGLPVLGNLLLVRKI